MRIEYIRPDIPALELPTYASQRNEAMVADTLDLQGRAALTLLGEPNDDFCER